MTLTSVRNLKPVNGLQHSVGCYICYMLFGYVCCMFDPKAQVREKKQNTPMLTKHNADIVFYGS